MLVFLKRILIVLVTVFVFFMCSSYNRYESQTNEVIWSDTACLSWDHFRGEVPIEISFEESAVSAYRLKYTYAVIGNRAYVKVYAAFNPNSSWVKADSKTNSLLKHEQGHFNLAEIYARKFRQILRSKSTVYVESQAEEKFSMLFKEICAESEQRQSLYDEETVHSANPVAQAKWNRAIALELKALEKYSSPSVQVLFDTE